MIFFQVIVRGVLRRPIRRHSLHHALCVGLASFSLQSIASVDRLQVPVRIEPEDATHARMHNQPESHAAAADRTKSDLLTRAAQRRREMEQDVRMLTEPAVMDKELVLAQRNSIAPMWSAIHD